jgi:hypothetical protein
MARRQFHVPPTFDRLWEIPKMRPFFVGVFVLMSILIASTASAQLADLARQAEAERTAAADKTYTNADLVIRTVAPTVAPTASSLVPVHVTRVVWLDPVRYIRTAAPPASRVTIIPSSPSAGPFGEFKPFDPARRLDGTSIDRSPAVYGPKVVVAVPWWIH